MGKEANQRWMDRQMKLEPLRLASDVLLPEAIVETLVKVLLAVDSDALNPDMEALYRLPDPRRFHGGLNAFRPAGPQSVRL